MAKQKNQKKKFVVALPRSLPTDRDLGYSGIEKIAGTFAGSPQAAVSKYLHRINPTNAKLITHILNQEMGGAKIYAFELPEVAEIRGGREENIPGERERMMQEYTLAYDLYTCYGGSPASYIGRARKVIESFQKKPKE
jgi:hypothetical protein